MERKEEFYKRISDALVDLDEEQVLTLTKSGLKEGLSPFEILEIGLSKGIRRIGASYASGDLTLPHKVAKICDSLPNMDFVMSDITAQDQPLKVQIFMSWRQ